MEIVRQFLLFRWAVLIDVLTLTYFGIAYLLCDGYSCLILSTRYPPAIHSVREFYD